MKDDRHSLIAQQSQSEPIKEQRPLVTQPADSLDIFGSTKLIIVAAVAYFIDFGALIASNKTNDYNFATTMENVTVIIGVVAALLLGAGLLQLTLKSVSLQGGRLNTKTRIGIAMLIASPVFNIIILIPGLIFLIAGLQSPPDGARTPLSGIKKGLIVGLTFIGGGVAGIIISLLIYVATSERACQLSGSKCY